MIPEPGKLSWLSCRDAQRCLVLLCHPQPRREHTGSTRAGREKPPGAKSEAGKQLQHHRSVCCLRHGDTVAAVEAGPWAAMEGSALTG